MLVVHQTGTSLVSLCNPSEMKDEPCGVFGLAVKIEVSNGEICLNCLSSIAAASRAASRAATMTTRPDS